MDRRARTGRRLQASALRRQDAARQADARCPATAAGHRREPRSQVCHNEPVTDRDQILEALEVVIDPELHRSIVELDMVRSIDVSVNGVADITVSLTTPGCPIKGHFQTAVAEAAVSLQGIEHC